MSGWGAVVRVKAGELVWNQGDPADHAVLVEAGQLEVIRYSRQGEAAVLGLASVGEVCGEMSCLDGQPHSATLRAQQESQLRRMTRAQFLQWVSEDPVRQSQLLQRQNERLRQLSTQLSLVSFEPVMTRLARFLFEQDGPETRLTQQELGERLATTRESISKALSELARRGILRLGRGRITVENQALLEQLLEQRQS